MLHFWICNLVLITTYIITIAINVQTMKFCRKKERLISVDEIDDYLLVDVENNETVILLCRYCEVIESNPQPKIWYWQDRFQNNPEEVVKLGMDNNISLNRIHMTPDLSLIIKNVENADTGIYRCHGEEGQEIENKFNYKLEPVFKDETVTAIEKGNITEWEKYREINILPVTRRFAVSNMAEISTLRKNGIVLEIISEWGPWGPCENCINNRGFRTCAALCRIKRHINEIHNTNSNVVEFFKKSPILPCRSSVLADILPSVSQATRYLPPFILVEKCKNCPKVKKVKKFRFRYKRRHVLLEGTHLATACPESNLESQVVWRKDGLILKKGTGQSYRKKEQESKIIVDAFSTLYLIDVSNNEEGNYTCYVNDINMMSLKVVVVSKSKLLTKAFFRHLSYLGFIILLTTFCYCTGLFATYRRRNKFKIQNYEEIKSQNTKKIQLSEVIE